MRRYVLLFSRYPDGCVLWCSSQLQLVAVQIRVKAATSAVSESKQYLSKLPESLKDVEKALVPLRK